MVLFLGFMLNRRISYLLISNSLRSSVPVKDKTTAVVAKYIRHCNLAKSFVKNPFLRGTLEGKGKTISFPTEHADGTTKRLVSPGYVYLLYRSVFLRQKIFAPHMELFPDRRSLYPIFSLCRIQDVLQHRYRRHALCLARGRDGTRNGSQASISLPSGAGFHRRLAGADDSISRPLPIELK